MSTDKLFEDEELIAETTTHGFGEANWFSKRNLVLGACTLGFWYIVPVVKALTGQTTYTITDERIIEERGIVTSSTKQTTFESVVGDVTSEQTPTQAVADVGDVTFTIQRTIDTAAETGSIGERERDKRQQDVQQETVTLSGVYDYEDVANRVRELQRE